MDRLNPFEAEMGVAEERLAGHVETLWDLGYPVDSNGQTGDRKMIPGDNHLTIQKPRTGGSFYVRLGKDITYTFSIHNSAIGDSPERILVYDDEKKWSVNNKRGSVTDPSERLRVLVAAADYLEQLAEFNQECKDQLRQRRTDRRERMLEVASHCVRFACFLHYIRPPR